MMGAAALAVLLVFLHTPSTHGQGGSPVQPEYTGQPVPAGPSVNEFTGDFSYGLPVLTVPGPHGSSYSLTLSYQAGTNPNSDVSWVGYGWSLNPGAVVRHQQGFPDDWDGEVLYHNKQPVNYTVKSTWEITAEIGSGDLLDDEILSALDLELQLSSMRQYNSYTGYHNLFMASSTLNFLGDVGLQFTNDDGEKSLSPVLPFDNIANSLRPIGREPRTRDFSMEPPAILSMEGEAENTGRGIGITLTQGVILGADFKDNGHVMRTYTRPTEPLHAYGYLHSAMADTLDPGVMDYYYENDVAYILDNKFLPIPFSNADQFSVTGGGSFRAFNRNPGVFYQNRMINEFDVDNIEWTINGGAAWGVGARWADGDVSYASGPWHNPNAPDHQFFTDKGDEPWFFRFSGDLGGTLLYDNNDKPVQVSVVEYDGLVGDLADLLGLAHSNEYPLLPSGIRLHQEDWERPGRSGYIGFTLNKDMLLKKNDKYYRSYNRSPRVRNYLAGDRDNMPDQIGEFALFGPGKSRYVYGLPVYVKNVKSLDLGLKNIKLDSAANIHHNSIVYRYTDETTAPLAVGQEIRDPYAVAWLLTEITTPDYVDLTGDGPSDDDLGGWTKFHYARHEGVTRTTEKGDIGWGYWRQPYRGLFYDPGDLSDPEDDLGGYSEGLRERYYLSRIETKTHVALFLVNSSDEQRKDGYSHPVYLSDADVAGDSTVTSASYIGGVPAPGRQRYLQRIDLYTKHETELGDSLLASVHFEYDYSLRPDMPNSLPVHPDSTTRFGMLTLRKVWTERMNVRNARIAPVVFGYEYRRSGDYAAPVQTRYPDITSFADHLSPEHENPSYNMYDFDVWGNYRAGGAARWERHFPYVPQNDTTTWDPAAWQLKWIRTAEGGEIQIHYEEDDYAFVHDHPAVAMVSLVEKPTGGGFGQESKDEAAYNKYYLRLADIGVDSTVYEDVAKVRELLLRRKSTDKKIFFKFFYALKGTDTDFENPEYNSEYIEGYADLDTVVLETINAGMADEWYALHVKLIGRKNGGTVHDYGVPKQVCWDVVRKRKRGKLGPNQGVANSSKTGDMVDALKMKYVGFNQSDHCKDIDYARSYIQVPMITPKKGGGLRVKRLLAYDPRIEGDSALYGTEYHYEVYDQERDEVISSGVAANEPTADENPLVAYIVNEEGETWVGKVLAKRDRERIVGPIGASVLPDPSVGYSRVAMNPIHQGATATGFSVADFHTYRDYPYDIRFDGIGKSVDYTEIKGTDYETAPTFQSFLTFGHYEYLLSRTQGYRFIISGMPGQMRRVLANGGAYTPLEKNWLTGSMTEYQYYQPGDSVPLLYRVGDSIRYGYPGKVMEIVHGSRENIAHVDNFKVEGDAGIWFVSGRPYYAVSLSRLSTHVTTKIVGYPAIIKGVRTYSDGNYNYVENVAFNPYSGAPLVTRARDDFDGLALDQSPSGHHGAYLGYSFPAVNVHPEFDQVSGNERALIESSGSFQILKKKDGSGTPYLVFSAGNETRWLRKLTPGDFIELTASVDGADAGRYHVDVIDGNTVWLLPSGLYNAASDPSLSLIDEVVDVEVIHSGRVNVPGVSMATVTTYGETDAEVTTGANFGWSGPGAAARLAFVDQLNNALAWGVGNFNSGNVDSTLQFRLYGTDTCGTLDSLGKAFTLAAGSNSIYIASLTTPVHTDTLTHLGLGGWFALNDAGQVVFRSQGHLPTLHRWRSQPGEEQRVWNFTFCGDDIYRSVENVISASAAGRFNDTVDYNGGGVAAGAGEPNAYETGERGRWGPRTAYSYKTEITGGSSPVAGERIYKDAGVFEDFSLFNWTEPESSDMTKWVQLGSITGINRHNLPYGSVDMLGRSSVTLFDYGQDSALLPIMSAWNAEEGTVMFESFEVYDNGDFGGSLTDSVVHSGKLSLKLIPFDTTEFAFSLIANEHLLNKGGILYYWKSGGSFGLYGPIDGSSLTIFFDNAIARVGDWELCRILYPASYLNFLFDPGDTITIRFANPNFTQLFIDDLKFQPMDAVAAGYVYDKKTFRPVAAFDNENFGVYPQYDAEGKAIRTIVETSRGMRTVSEAHVHIPGAERSWLGDGAPFTFGAASGGGAPAGLFRGAMEPQDGTGQGAAFDMLNLELGLDRQNLTLFGLDPDKLRDLVQEKAGEVNLLTQKEQGILDRYEELNARYQTLQKAKEEAATDEAKEGIEQEMQAIEQERDQLLEQLGITGANR